MHLELGEMVQLAKSLWAIAADETEEAQLAVASFARNLATRGGAPPHKICAELARLRIGTARVRSHFKEPRFWRLVVLLHDVWAGERPDPTGGAVRVHRHDEEPDWARGASPSALIGPWLFYR